MDLAIHSVERATRFVCGRSHPLVATITQQFHGRSRGYSLVSTGPLSPHSRPGELYKKIPTTQTNQ